MRLDKCIHVCVYIYQYNRHYGTIIKIQNISLSLKTPSCSFVAFAVKFHPTSDLSSTPLRLVLSVLQPLINGMIVHVPFCVRLLLSFSTLLIFVYVAAYVSGNRFLFVARWCLLYGHYHNLPPDDGYLGSSELDPYGLGCYEHSRVILHVDVFSFLLKWDY